MVVVIHDGLKCESLSLYFLAVDFFAKKDENPKDVKGYKFDCKVAKEFLRQHSNYRYIASQELLNAEVLADLINRNDIDEVYFYNRQHRKFESIK